MTRGLLTRRTRSVLLLIDVEKRKKKSCPSTHRCYKCVRACGHLCSSWLRFDVNACVRVSSGDNKKYADETHSLLHRCGWIVLFASERKENTHGHMSRVKKNSFTTTLIIIDIFLQTLLHIIFFLVGVEAGLSCETLYGGIPLLYFSSLNRPILRASGREPVNSAWRAADYSKAMSRNVMPSETDFGHVRIRTFH